MIRFDGANDGDVWRFFEIPELETTHFVDNDGIRFQSIKRFNSWGADVADEIGIFMMGVEQGFNKRASGAFAFGSGDADDWARAVFKEITG